MEKVTHNCYGCGGSFAREELQYRPSGKGAYRRERYFCPACNAKEEQKNTLCLCIFIPQFVAIKTWLYEP
jgi:hypothetical protein